MSIIGRISKMTSSFIRNIWEICVRSIIVPSNFFLRKKKLRISAQMENIELNIEFAELYNKNLAKIIVSNDNPTYSSIDGVLYSKDGTKLIRFPPASKMSTFQVPDSVSSIENVAFAGSSLNNINVSPNNLTYNSIDGVLYSKDGTELIRFPPGSKKNSFQVPNSVTSIGEWAFSGCTHLIKLTIPDSVSSIENGAFLCCELLAEITIPDSVTSIGNKAFVCCESLTKLTIPNSVTSIGDEAFMDCTSLIKLTIPNSVTSIGERAFSGCTSLTELTISDSVTSIGKEAFKGCTSLTKLTIPNSVISIGWWTFAGCTHLTTIMIPNSVTSIENGAFAGCTSLNNINVSPNNLTYSSIDGVLYSKDGTELIRFPPGSEKNTFQVPDSVTSIGYEAFRGCTSLIEVTIPNSITSIGGEAFSGCTSLTKLTIPNSVTSIGDAAFMDCTSLIKLTIPNSVTSIGDAVFWGCESLTKVTIPDSVTSIDRFAFLSCPVTIIAVPGSYAWNYAQEKGIKVVAPDKE